MVISCGRSAPVGPATSPEQTPPAKPAATEPERSEPIGFEMHNVRLRMAPDIVLQVNSLRGRLVSRHPGPPVFDDQRSFYIDVEGAEMTLDAASVTALVNDVFAYDGSPLSDLEVQLRDGRVEQKGKLRKGLPIPFSVEADVDASGGFVRLHPVKTRAAGVPATKIMDVFGVELDDLIRVRAGRGITVRDNDLFLAPSQMLASPSVRGRVSAAAVRGDRLHLILGDPAVAAARPSEPRQNYLWFRGGRIRFGRLTMTNTDLRLIDADRRDPFEFYAERYNDQLVAGYSRNTPDGALRTYMPDYEDRSRGPLPPPALGGARRRGGL
ncbi:MAG: hypothetical protein ACRD1S_13510 [Vicinamibacterales bacterium]